MTLYVHSPIADACESSVVHYAEMRCGGDHHIGPVIQVEDPGEHVKMFCGECWTLMGFIAVTAHDARNALQYRFIPVQRDAHSYMEV